MSNHALFFGGLHLTDGFASSDGYSMAVLSDGISFGVAKGVQEVVAALMGDGDLVRIRRHGNREVTFAVEISGDSLASVALGEAALRAEVGKVNLVTWQPPDDFSPATVFAVLTSEMVQTFDDLNELGRRRIFVVTLTCAPHARSVESTAFSVVAGPPPAPTTVAVTNADTTTGWSATKRLNSQGGGGSPIAVTVTDEGAFVRAKGGAVESAPPYGLIGPNLLTLTYTRAAMNLTATPLLQVEFSGSQPTGFSITDASGTRTVSPLLVRANSSGTTLYVLPADTTSFTGFSVRREIVGGVEDMTFNVYDVSATNSLAQVGTRQVSKTVQIGGTERTNASVRVKSASADLGHTIVASWPERGSGFSPPLRRWRANGNTVVPDAATITGSHEAIGPTAVTFGVPSASIPPGAYQIVGRLRSVGSTGSLNIFWEAATSVQGVTLDGSVSGSYDASFPTVGKWEIVPLGTVTLPVIAATNGDLLLGINHAGSTQVEYDEIWLLPVGEDCAISAANVVASRFWCDAPELGDINPSLRIGNTDDRSNARSPGLSTFAKGMHVVRPGGVTFFVASLVDNPLVDGHYTKCWHSNAAE